jgi:outer membrane lipoprotein-sorting protein
MKPSHGAMMALSVALAVSRAMAAQTQAPSPDQVLQHSRDTYAALKSYSDSGSITTTYRSGGAPASVETATLHTWYQAPRQFNLDYQRGAAAGGDRFVLWSEGQDFNTWWSSTHVHTDYPQGRGGTAFALGAYPTKGATVMIAPLLFAKGGLQGPIANFTLTQSEGIDRVGEHPCYRLRGQESIAYKSGTVAGARVITIWIDTQSWLVRKVFEDTPTDSGSGTVNSVTTVLEPVANPAIEAAKFHFEVPKN